GRTDDFYEERYTAANKLLKRLLSAVKKAGLDAEVIRDRYRDEEWVRIRSWGVNVAVKVDNGYLVLSDEESQVRPAIAYDPARNAFVGTDEDHSIGLSSGQRRPRRDALTVAAEAVVELLEKQEKLNVQFK